MNYIAIDTETTGLEPGSRLVELAAIGCNDHGIFGRFESLIDPGMPIPADTSKVNGITDDMVVGKPSADVVLQDFFKWADMDTDFIAHHARYDTGIISWDAARWGITILADAMIIDTKEIAKEVGATKTNHLATLVEHYGIEREGEAHRAMSDADACMKYFRLIDRQCVRRPWVDAGHDYTYTDEFPEKLANLPELVATATPLSFTYEDAKGNVRDRMITPYGWALKNGELYFHGRCHMRDDRRTFRADRVK